MQLSQLVDVENIPDPQLVQLEEPEEAEKAPTGQL